MSDTTQMPPVEAHLEGAQCETCNRVARETAESEDTSFAFLLALVPVLALTFFGNLGLLSM